jgi:exopolyphosphatase/guanosine-5'-triphosphate,3'-diphosphate pyrophosphatase
MTNKTYAGIDLGSNSCKLLICDSNGHQLCLKNYPTRLAEGMYEHNRLTPEAMDRGRQCFFEYRQLLDKYGVEPQNMRAITTAACRMAENGSEFVKAVYNESGIHLEIIDGLEEATLNLKGALEHVCGQTDYVVLYDLGGGSTEVTLATNHANPKIVHSISIPWGARNASEAFGLVEYDADKAAHLAQEINGYMDGFMQQADLPHHQNTCFVATSSTPLRLVSMIKHFGDYDRERADGLVMTRQEMDMAINELLQSSRETLAKNPYVGDKRSYIFIAACVIFKSIYEKLQVPQLTASLKSAKDGIVLGLMERDKILRHN